MPAFKKMLMISYNEAVDADVMEILRKCSADTYTKFVGVFGRGIASGTHLGNDIWPGKNNALFVGCDEKTAKQIVMYIKELRKALGSEGVKAFVLPVEEVT